MVDRLVLGRDSLVYTVATSLRDQPGTVTVGTTDEQLSKSLGEEGVTVEDVEPTDTATLDNLEADLVFVLESTRAANLAAARAARRAFPAAYLLVSTGMDALEQDGELAEIADKTVDPVGETARYILDRVGDESQQTRQLWHVLAGIDDLAVVTHDNPDPDAIASGVALARIATAAGCRVEVCYYGEITHQENRAFVNLLDIELRNLEPGEDISEFDGLALVDHSRPGVNDQLPADARVDVVIDHHPPRSPVDARFVDLRSGVGATSTLLVGYLDYLGIEIDEAVATALLFGIHVDTNGFVREVSREDFEAAATLVQSANLGLLERIESPSVSATTVETVASAIRNRRIDGEVLLSCVGTLSDRDALAQAADRLLMLEGVTTTLVYGFTDEMIFASARSRGSKIDLGETVREAFGQIGSAGGHVDMAGAQITLGVLEAVDEQEESLQEIVEEIIATRFLDAVEANTTHTVTGVYATDVETADEFHVPSEDAPALQEGNDGDQSVDGEASQSVDGEASQSVDGEDNETTRSPTGDASDGDQQSVQHE